jgi:hypothetical protein
VRRGELVPLVESVGRRQHSDPRRHCGHRGSSSPRGSSSGAMLLA